MRVLYSIIIIALISFFSGCNKICCDDPLVPFICEISFLDQEGNDIVETLKLNPQPEEEKSENIYALWETTYDLICLNKGHNTNPLTVDVQETPRKLTFDTYFRLKTEEMNKDREIIYEWTYPLLFGDESKHKLILYFKGYLNCYQLSLDGEIIPVENGVATVYMEK